MIRITIFFLVFIVLLPFLSCKKLLDPGEQPDKLNNATVFSTDSLVEKYVNGIYYEFMKTRQDIFNGGISWIASLSADELVCNRLSVSSDFFLNDLAPDNVVLEDTLWKKAYHYIYGCNFLIEGLTGPNSISPALKDRALGEAKFLRAFSYYYMSNLFGEVPLVLVTDYTKSAFVPRTNIETIYKQIISDLTDAELLLDDNRSNAYAGKLACQSLLARVYLHMHQWDKAEQYSTMVINSGRLQLETTLDNVFIKNSRETIFQLEPVMSPYNTVEGIIFQPYTSGAVPEFSFNVSLDTAFEPGDQRKEYWTKNILVNGNSYRIPFKYKIKSAGPPATEYNVVLRLAEQYLIRAEARAMKADVQDAVSDLNIIRRRAGLSDLQSSISLAECIKAVEKERQVELFTEWGHRWIDIKRTNRADEIMKGVKGADWKTEDQLYPIPSVELKLNHNLNQNKGYE